MNNVVIENLANGSGNRSSIITVITFIFQNSLTEGYVEAFLETSTDQ